MSWNYLQSSLYRSALKVLSDNAAKAYDDALNAGGGILRCFPSYVGRKFCRPGRNLNLVDEDYYPEGPNGWAIDERWFGCWILADTGNGLYGEGMAHFHHPDGFVFRMADAVLGNHEHLVGPMYATMRGTGFYNKYFDNEYPLGHHLHPWKFEAYNFTHWVNRRYSMPKYTSLGLLNVPRLDQNQLIEFVEKFVTGEDNGIRSWAQNLLIRMETGMLMPTKMLHGPAAVCTEEPQTDLDDYRFYQSHVESPDGLVPLGADLLRRHLPANLSEEEQVYRLVDDIDLEANIDPNFIRDNLLHPIPDARQDKHCKVEWRVYGKIRGREHFSLKQIELDPGTEIELVLPPAMCIVHFMNGQGLLNTLPVNVRTSGIKLGEELNDEFVIPYETARSMKEIVIRNTGTEVLAGTLCWGPDVWGDKMPPSPGELMRLATNPSVPPGFRKDCLDVAIP